MTEQKLFGTDGIRGTVGQKPMTAEFAFRLGVAVAQTFEGDAEPVQALVGMDTRESGPMFAHAIAAGITSCGADILWLGVMPTPGVAYLTRELGGTVGIVISASHNPYTDNGIKLFDRLGQKLSDGVEARIEGLLDTNEAEPEASRIGRSARYRHEDGEYPQFLLSHAPYLDGLKVGIDCANGAASDIAPHIFRRIGAKLVVINHNPDGRNINVECGSSHPQAIRDCIIRDGLEVGVAFDGDADRVQLVDCTGRIVTGDHMLAINAVSRGESAVVATQMTNFGTERYLTEQGISLYRTRVGDRHVFEALREKELLLGGEQSGHLLFLDLASTGDGLLTALQTLAAIRKSDATLEDWVDAIPVFPQTLINVKVPPDQKAALATCDEVKAAVHKAKEALGTDGRIDLRPSGTEPLIRIMVEGNDVDAVGDVAHRVAEAVEEAAKIV